MPTKGKIVAFPDISVSDFMYQKLLEHGDAVALVDNDQDGKTITFREIYQRSRRCAGFLYKQGLRKTDFVGLIAPSSTEYSIAVLGILSCGAAVAPCDPDFREDEILHLFNVLEPRMVIVHEDVLQTMKKLQEKLTRLEKIFVISKDDRFLISESELASEIDMGFLGEIEIDPEEDVAIVPYSSGTTGLPKLVLRTHRNFVSYLAGSVSTTPLNKERDVYYMDRPLFHVGGIGAMLLTLAMGIKMIFQKNLEIQHTMETIQKYKVTVLATSPSMMIRLAHAENIQRQDFSSLKLLVSLGGSPAPAIIQRLAEKFQVFVFRSYGMTEVGAISGSIDMTNLETVGRPEALLEVKIIDTSTAKECPSNQSGEILVRGPQVMKGYFKNRGATEQTLDRDGWMHTGDIGHIDENGLLFVIDRLKDVIKYKGLQVSPVELEGVILKHPNILDVGVIGIPDPVVGEVPKAFVVRKHNGISEQDVEKFVQGHLVEYKHLRGGVKFVDAIPKSTMGKILRIELKKMAELC